MAPPTPPVLQTVNDTDSAAVKKTKDDANELLKVSFAEEVKTYNNANKNNQYTIPSTHLPKGKTAAQYMADNTDGGGNNAGGNNNSGGGGNGGADATASNDIKPIQPHHQEHLKKLAGQGAYKLEDLPEGLKPPKDADKKKYLSKYEGVATPAEVEAVQKKWASELQIPANKAYYFSIELAIHGAHNTNSEKTNWDVPSDIVTTVKLSQAVAIIKKQMLTTLQYNAFFVRPVFNYFVENGIIPAFAIKRGVPRDHALGAMDTFPFLQTDVVLQVPLIRPPTDAENAAYKVNKDLVLARLNKPKSISNILPQIAGVGPSSVQSQNLLEL